MRSLVSFFLLPLSFSTAFPVYADEPILPLPEQTVISQPEKVKLGRRLFEDRQLSRDRTISCASCHDLTRGGVDGQKVSVGIGGSLGSVNAPTVFNSGFNFRQFWDGRASSLEEQIDGPVEHPKEMGFTWAELIARLAQDSGYREQFEKLYDGGITRPNIKDAIATFERSLVTGNSPFDLYLRGATDALTEREKKGYQKFKSYGCIACHQGMNVGGNMFQTMGVMGDYFKDRGTPITPADLGRYAITKQASDRYVFRVPSLRNVALTSPYFHDGSAKTLEQAVRVMAKYQLGRALPEEDIKAITAFLKTLSGEINPPGGKAP